MFENAQRLGVEALPSPRGQAQPGDLVGEGVLETEFRAARAAFLVQEVGGLEAIGGSRPGPLHRAPPWRAGTGGRGRARSPRQSEAIAIGGGEAIDTRGEHLLHRRRNLQASDRPHQPVVAALTLPGFRSRPAPHALLQEKRIPVRPFDEGGPERRQASSSRGDCRPFRSRCSPATDRCGARCRRTARTMDADARGETTSAAGCAPRRAQPRASRAPPAIRRRSSAHPPRRREEAGAGSPQ